MQNIKAKDCTIIVPAYNEEERIKPFLKSLSSFKGTIIFVCDGSDRTPEVIRDFSERRKDRSPEVICLEYPERLGKGGGITAGILNSETQYVGFTDADGSTSESEMIRLFSYLSDYDCAIGSRWMKETDVVVKKPFSRRVQSRLLNIAIRLILNISLSDTQCGAKVFRRSALNDVMPDMKTKGFEYDAELLWRLKNKGYSIKEVPIVWENREDTSVGRADGAGMIIRLFKMRLGKSK